ncbi:MAG TPA: glycosyltransferase [Myxococcales bacterium]
MRIVVNAFGTAGDVNPFIAIARALAALGHEPILALNPACEAAAKETGLRFVPVGPRWDVDEVAGLERYLDPNQGGINVWKEICLPNVAPTYRELGELISQERPDGVFAHFLCVGAQWAARAAQVRCAIATLAPCWWCSAERPAIFAPQVPPRWLHRHLMWVPRIAIDFTISKPMAPVCRELGRPFRKDEYFRIFQEADLDLGLWSPALRPPASDDPPRSQVVGFPFQPGAAPQLDPKIGAFLESGPAPVVIGLGTSVRNLGPQFLPGVARACARLGRRSLLVGAELPDLPEGALAVRAAPYSAVFPRAEAIVHHGGAGTTAEALRAGKPTLIAPFASDQFDNALNAERAGVSRTLPRAKLTEASVAAALAKLLASAETKERAARLGEVLRAEPPGAEAAAGALAAFFSSRAPAY